jgi:hypothetical protein
VQSRFIDPGSPWQNECFNGTLRNEFLNELNDSLCRGSHQ